MNQIAPNASASISSNTKTRTARPARGRLGTPENPTRSSSPSLIPKA
jgi:hypothetical protein